VVLTEFQRAVCRLLAAERIRGGESYVAGGAALGEILSTPRQSRDIDLFHDTEEALQATWAEDRRLLREAGYEVRVLRESRAFVEAEVARGGDGVVVEWARESAYRFFPLVRHDVLGLALHPFDLSTNEVLALVGRLEVRDWIDLLECMDRIQGLGYLAWAACGKDPAFGPAAILEQAARSSRYTQGEVSALAFAGRPPDAGELSRRWHRGLAEARRIVALLPSEEAGRCVLGEDGRLYRGDVEALAGDLGEGKLRFHSGRIRGAFPSPADLA
jgi:hypothetical protein